MRNHDPNQKKIYIYIYIYIKKRIIQQSIHQYSQQAKLHDLIRMYNLIDGYIDLQIINEAKIIN